MWSIREICGYDSPKVTSEKIKSLFNEGESAINVIPDTPTQNIIDSDHPLAKVDVGLEGPPLMSLRDMEIMMEGIPIEQVSMTLSSEHPYLLFFYFGAAEKQGVPLDKVRATILNDPVHQICARFAPNTYPIDLGLRVTVDTINFCSKNAPRVYASCVGAAATRESGTTAAQEIAIDFCCARKYMQEAVRRGANIDEIAPRVSFTHRCGIDIFEEAAKFRAARKVWAKMLKDEFGAKDPRSLTYKVHVVTKGSDLTRQQPHNNIIRIAYQALAAVLGGVQSMHTDSFDEPLCLPTEEAHRIAVRTQQILAYETGVINVADPLGGSYYVESLTSELEQEINKVIDEWKEEILEAAASGKLFSRIFEQAAQFQRELESGERILVGVNKFTIAEEAEIPTRIHRPNKEATREHLENVKELRRTRDNSKVRKALEDLRHVAERRDENVCSAIIEAVRSYATLAEIGGTIRLAYDYPYDPFKMLEYPFA